MQCYLLLSDVKRVCGSQCVLFSGIQMALWLLKVADPWSIHFPFYLYCPPKCTHTHTHGWLSGFNTQIDRVLTGSKTKSEANSASNYLCIPYNYQCIFCPQSIFFSLLLNILLWLLIQLQTQQTNTLTHKEIHTITAYSDVCTDI